MQMQHVSTSSAHYKYKELGTKETNKQTMTNQEQNKWKMNDAITFGRM
jgi:hypothetical protein